MERRYPTLPLRPGQSKRREFEYIRHAVVDLLAAFDVRTGHVFGQCYTHHRKIECRHCLRGLRARDPDRRWHLLLDNASSHTKAEAEVVEGCAAQRPKIMLHWVPYHGAWLNHVAIWLSILSRKGLRRAKGGSTRELCYLIYRFIDTWHVHFAHPFQGTYNRMSVTFLSWVTRHTSIEARAYIWVCDRTGDLASGGHGTASSHGDHYRGSS